MIAEIPVLDEGRCTGCGYCAELCPCDCLAMAGGIPWLARPLDCVACNLCVLACPDLALRLAELEPA
jgi:NAD-dependent dihydropyrimidine dehydrogenase PreA subunit